MEKNGMEWKKYIIGGINYYLNEIIWKDGLMEI